MTPLYERLSNGIRVRVQPRFSLARSEPADRQFVFSYHVFLENLGDRAAQLLWRHWHIHDATGDDTEVDGEGVIGQQPLLVPGARHEYESFCVLRSPVGWMEGHYTFERGDGTRFDVAIPRFELAAPISLPENEEGDPLMH
ncbi:MAG: Co2+/Mg2+ efflux protein ApaG [Gemmatimonadetes bacterium]|nr:Co2+/Mg2+ efflux protein ApaG [Gemmatimonadota bacterium]